MQLFLLLKYTLALKNLMCWERPDSLKSHHHYLNLWIHWIFIDGKGTQKQLDVKLQFL